MKKLLVLSLGVLLTHLASAQHKFPVPSVTLKSMDGKSVELTSLLSENGPTVISFWATWCGPCKRELNNISELYPDWQDETGVKIVAISIDDARSVRRVKPYVNGQAWDFEIALDTNQDLKRAMNVNNIPHTFLVDAEGNVVWQHNSYVEGDEYELYDQILDLSK